MRHPRAKPFIGLVYLLVVAGLIGASVAAYRKDFPWQRTVAVSVLTASAGMSLNPNSDVKLKGLLVGQVAGITSDGRTATLHLALDPAQTHLVPAAVDAAIVPKTLFGEKYVNLIPLGDSGTPISAGAVIRQTRTAVEVSELYTHLEGVLQTLRPDQLSLALGSLAQALQGRGRQLGDTAARFDTYLKGLNPHLPTLVHDFHQLASTSETYAAAAPDLLRTLDNGSALSAELLQPKEQALAEFLGRSEEAAGRTTRLVDRAGDTLVDLTDRTRPVADLVARYAPELPCMVDTLNLSNSALNHVLGGGGPWLTASIDVITQLPPYQLPKDLPANPSSGGHNQTLPVGIPSWAPHCTVIPSQLRGVQNIGPYAWAARGPVAGR